MRLSAAVYCITASDKILSQQPSSSCHPPGHAPRHQILPRNANLEVAAGPTGPPPEQDIPLQVGGSGSGSEFSSRPRFDCQCPALSPDVGRTTQHLSASPPAPQVPKKTRLYVEQTQRERENAADMHRIFQV